MKGVNDTVLQKIEEELVFLSFVTPPVKSRDAKRLRRHALRLAASIDPEKEQDGYFFQLTNSSTDIALSTAEGCTSLHMLITSARNVYKAQHGQHLAAAA